MFIRHISGLVLAAILFSSAWGPGCAQTSPRVSSSPAHQATAFRTQVTIPSRATDQDENGFYDLETGLADDYPEQNRSRKMLIQDLKLARELGVRFLRVGMGWDEMEPAPGKYEFEFWDQLMELAPKYGVTVLPYVAYSPKWTNSDRKDYWRQPPAEPRDFGRFMKVISRRYRGKVGSWEIWNEPDLEHYWLGDVDTFARLLEEGAKGVRLGDPSAVIVLGGLAQARSKFAETLFREHPVRNWVDVVNVHGYLETWDATRAERYPRRLAKMQELIDQTAPGKEQWLAEFGYSSKPAKDGKTSEWSQAVFDYEHTERYQAVSLWKHHILMAASGKVSLATWYRIRDLKPKTTVIGDDNNLYLGIVDVDGNLKPAAFSLRFFNQVFDRPHRPASQRLKVQAKKNSEAEVHAFEKKDGTWIVTAWLRGPEPEKRRKGSILAKDLRRETISVTLPVSLKPDEAQLQTFNAQGKQVTSPARLTRLPQSRGSVISGIPVRGDEAFVAVIRSNEPKQKLADVLVDVLVDSFEMPGFGLNESKDTLASQR